MTAGVTDGVTIGHLCCQVHDCKNALKHHHDRFCLQHGHMNNQCAVQGCEQLAEHGYKMCIVPTHHAAEKGPRPSAGDCMSGGAPDSGSQSELCAGHSPGISEKKLKVNLGWWWTHNKQLFVRCCGIITSCATFFVSKGISGDFLKVTFPACYHGAMPSYIFYDNNCHLMAHLMAHLLHTGDTYFSNVGLLVDVFHFKSKHKETDIICQSHCNPARFRELVGGADTRNQWIFNSSAAEQANVWFGKFTSNVREMLPHRYNFYLDEMIAIRNQFIVSELVRKGQVPHIVPEAVLRGQA
ncbi:hypothetical protein K439DRAFT_1399876 [Ramaria rubella]|nr:hypothetical protein K439DRAFT_1399876 [Ramaria rubella]